MNISPGYPNVSYVPPVALSDFDSCGHAVQFYDDDAFLLDELVRFVGSALASGDAAIVVATQAHRDGLAQRLEARGLDAVLAMAEGRYVVLDAAETLSKFTLDGRPEAATFARLIGGIISGAASAVKHERPRVAAFGEMVALLWADGKPDLAIQVEELWNGLAESHSFELLCAYPMHLFPTSGDGASFDRICETHARVIPAESYTSLAGEDERLRAITLLQQKAQALESEIEERKRVEQVLREKNEELREAVATRDEFLSVAAHELKTPITSLRGFAQLLLRDLGQNREVSPERLQIALGTIELQTGKLNQLIARLLDTAQIEAGKLRIEPVPTDLAALIRSAISQHHAGENHKIDFEGPEQLEAVLDPVRFEQVVTNLLHNAVKFSPEGGVVTVALERTGDGGVRLSVTDRGLGVPPSQREQVFERFHQAHGGGHLSGLGLGLYITREIVALHGGLVWIEEPAHRGSRFVVTLPPSSRA